MYVLLLYSLDNSSIIISSLIIDFNLFNNNFGLKIPNNITLLNLWDQLVENKEHIAIVLDEYGGVDGVVTMEDVVETLLGLEITDENDEVVDMQKYAKERWKRRQKKGNILSEFRN